MATAGKSSKTRGRANGRDLTISAGGAATTAATVGLLMWIYNSYGIDLSSFSFWFVIPVGALLAGAAAASGYYFVAKWTHTMPTRRIMVNSIIIAGGAWMSLLWLKYVGMTFEDGTRVRDFVDFWTWFKITTENMSLNIGARGGSGVETGALGALGYVRQVIQFAGFAAGGLAVYAFLADAPICVNCRRYAKTRSLTKALEPAAFDDMIGAADVSFPGLVDAVSAVAKGKGISLIGLELQTCPECGGLQVAPQVWVGREDSPTRLPAYSADQDLVGSIEAAAKSS